MTGLGTAAGWSLAASMAAALAVLVMRDGRRRTAINEALHELRRPLQAIALTGSSANGSDGGPRGSMRLVATALERLDGVVNGQPGWAARERVRCESIARSAVGRWRARVMLDGGSLELCWWAGEATVEGDRDGLERALDNLIVNAIEHGASPILVEGRRRGDRLLVSVADSGSGPYRGAERLELAALRPRRRDLRRGHGLTVVRRVAAEHGGRFMFSPSPSGSTAVLELPLPADGPTAGGQ